MRLVLIDAANCLYRAFFALPPLRAADGFPTGALHGFGQMLAKVLREEKPDAVAVVFDAPGGSFRSEVFADYKAGRDAQPEDLTAQFPVAREMVEVAGLPLLEVPGYEADDVIATLVANAPADAEVVIVSSDKDLMQLVSERVTLLDTMKDRRIGPDEVEARFGVPPAHVLDVRALVGDPSDNIPGVRGIGEKGAAKLIGQFGSLDTLLERAGDVKAKRAREALQEQADAARLSRELATLRTDVPGCDDVGALQPAEPRTEELRALYARLELKRLLEALDAESGDDASPASAEVEADVGVETRVLGSRAELRSVLDALAEGQPLAFAWVGLEGLGGLPPEPAGLALALGDHEAAYVPIGSAVALPELVSELEGELAGGAPRPWLGRDTKRTQTLFAECGAPLPPPDFDVALAGFLLDPARAPTTEALALQLLERKVRPFEALAGRGAKAVAPSELLVDQAAAWAGEEAVALLLLAGALRPRLEQDGLLPLFGEIELPLTAVLSHMERAGVRVDEEALERLSSEFGAKLEALEGEIYSLAGETFSIGSPKQLQHILFEKLGLPPGKKTKTGYSTDESVLEQLALTHDLPARVLAHRRLSKLRSTYVDALPPMVNEQTGRIHPVFHQTGAATGRLSSSQPNVQNIPIRTEDGVRIREAFVPAEGRTLLSADYSQVELRILAHFSGDQSLREAFAEDADVHRRTAAEVGGIDEDDVLPEQRAAAKAVNFGIIYGLSAFGLAQQLGIATAEAQATIDAYFARYLGVRHFLDATIESARERGFTTTLFGRRRYLPDLMSRNRVLRQASERMAVNSVIQGTAADLMKKAMVEIDQALRERERPAQMILQVHDELVFEVAPGEIEAVGALARERMEGVYALEVPLRVELGVGASWREAH